MEIVTSDPEALLPEIRHAGAIFVGHYSSESLGDYCAGPNHVLPTVRTARFSSPLGVYDFVKRSNLINVSAAGAQRLGPIASVLAPPPSPLMFRGFGIHPVYKSKARPGSSPIANIPP